jgi:hypothetical protein
LGGIVSLQGGVPFSITSGGDSLNGNSPLGGRVDIVGDPYANPNRSYDHWFNTNAFAAPAFGKIGNFGGRLLGPANRRMDLSLRKQTALKENLRFTVVGEFFNFTNTPQFGPPDGNLRSPTYGRTLGAGGGLGANTLGPFGSRQVQLGARIDF